MNFCVEHKTNLETAAILNRDVTGGRISHAYLFAGTTAEKGEAAEAFARALLCSGPDQGRACGECRPCRQAGHGNHPDLHRIGPSGATIKIEQVRRMQHQVQYRSYQGGRKVFIIEPAEAMTAEAANCLLKTLEEPPEETVFILISNRPDACLPTILSRCRQMTFQCAGRDLTEEPAAGGMEVPGLAARLYDSGPAEALAMAEDAAGGDVQLLLDGLTRWYRDLLIWRLTGAGSLLFYPDRAELLAIESFRYDLVKLAEGIDALEKARRRVEGNSNKRLTLEVLFLNLAGY